MTTLGEIEDEYGVKFDDDREKPLAQWLREKGLPNMAEIVEKVEQKTAPNNSFDARGWIGVMSGGCLLTLPDDTHWGQT